MSGSSFVVPTLFLVPGKRLNCDIMDACDVAESTVTVSTKGLMNSSIFVQLLENFQDTVPGSVEIPLLLVYDVYGPHYNGNIVAKEI